MSYVTRALAGLIALSTLGLAACGTSPEPTGGSVGPAGDLAGAPEPAPAARSATVAPSPAEAVAPAELVSAERIAYALIPSQEKGLRLGSDPVEEHRIDLPAITFEFDSVVLTPQGRAQIDELAKVLAYQGAALYRFRLAGHTDTVGSAAYNEDLSRRRAEAARDYLVRAHGIRPERLEIVGYGESNPAMPTPDQVNEWRNRRVEVITLAGPAG